MKKKHQPNLSSILREFLRIYLFKHVDSRKYTGKDIIMLIMIKMIIYNNSNKRSKTICHRHFGVGNLVIMLPFSKRGTTHHPYAYCFITSKFQMWNIIFALKFESPNNRRILKLWYENQTPR